MFGSLKIRRMEKNVRENMRDFWWEWCLVEVILGKRKWWDLVVFSMGPSFYRPQITEKIGRRSLMKIAHLSLPVPPN